MMLLVKFAAFYGDQRHIVALTGVCYRTVSWGGRLIQSYPIFWSQLIMFFRFCVS